MDIVDLAMPTDATSTTTFKVWTTVNTLFSANKKTREVYLSGGVSQHQGGGSVHLRLSTPAEDDGRRPR
jgi:hypothetical protein